MTLAARLRFALGDLGAAHLALKARHVVGQFFALAPSGLGLGICSGHTFAQRPQFFERPLRLLRERRDLGCHLLARGGARSVS